MVPRSGGGKSMGVRRSLGAGVRRLRRPPEPLGSGPCSPPPPFTAVSECPSVTGAQFRAAEERLAALERETRRLRRRYEGKVRAREDRRREHERQMRGLHHRLGRTTLVLIALQRPRSTAPRRAPASGRPAGRARRTASTRAGPEAEPGEPEPPPRRGHLSDALATLRSGGRP